MNGVNSAIVKLQDSGPRNIMATLKPISGEQHLQLSATFRSRLGKWTSSRWFVNFLSVPDAPDFDRLVSRGAMSSDLASVGRAVPQLRQSVADCPAQLPNRFVGEDRSSASESIDADVQDGQRLP